MEKGHLTELPESFLTKRVDYTCGTIFVAFVHHMHPMVKSCNKMATLSGNGLSLRPELHFRVVDDRLHFQVLQDLKAGTTVDAMPAAALLSMS